jgi:hypothetical protein
MDAAISGVDAVSDARPLNRMARRFLEGESEIVPDV